MDLQKTYDENNIGKWDGWYKNLPDTPGSFQYGDTLTYELAAKFLEDCTVLIVKTPSVKGDKFIIP